MSVNDDDDYEDCELCGKPMTYSPKYGWYCREGCDEPQ